MSDEMQSESGSFKNTELFVDEMGPVEKFCKICKKRSEQFLQVEEAVEGRTLLSIINRLKQNKVPELPSDFLFCMDCALSLHQADIFVYRLEQALKTVVTGQIEHQSAQVAETTDKEGHILEDISQIVSKGEPNKMIATTGKWLFECRMCIYATYSRKWFRKHMQRKHKDNDQHIYRCPYCSKLYQRPNAIQNHISHEHMNQSKPKRLYRKTFVSKVRPKESYMFKCDKCRYQIGSEKCFKNHLVKKHKDTDFHIYKCRSCDKTYQRFHSLRYHVASMHGNENQKELPMSKDDTSESDSSFGELLIGPPKKTKRKRSTETPNDSLPFLNSGLDSSPEHFVKKKKLKLARNLSVSLENSPNFEMVSPRTATVKEKYLDGEQTEKETSTPNTPKKRRNIFKKAKFKIFLPQKGNVKGRKFQVQNYRSNS